jgi:hypothetical protein
MAHASRQIVIACVNTDKTDAILDKFNVVSSALSSIRNSDVLKMPPDWHYSPMGFMPELLERNL